MKSLSERRAFWAKHIADWRQSGLSRSAYCKPLGLRVNQLCYWIKKAPSTDSGQTSANFIPVTAKTPTPKLPGADFTILLPSGEILQWQGEANPAYIQQLAKGLGQ